MEQAMQSENNTIPSDSAMEARARRAARAAGLTASKSRSHVGSVDNYGHFNLVDGNNMLVA